jgi:hypothetical protein
MRTSVKASLAVALLLATAAAAAGLGAGSGSASRRAGTPPASIALPAISGLQVGQTLTVTPGTWAGDQPMTFEYTWQRSDGTTFHAIPGVPSNATSYTLTDADIGHNLLVQVKAINAAGWAWGTSAPTSHVNGATAGDTVDLGGGLIGVSVNRVTLPNRLVVSAAEFSPTALAPGGSLTATVHVTDTAGHPVSGALVQVIGLPFGSIKPTAEVPTGADGTARITLAATAQLARVPGGAIALSIRARKNGDNVLAGVTATRLVKLSITH